MTLANLRVNCSTKLFKNFFSLSLSQTNALFLHICTCMRVCARACGCVSMSQSPNFLQRIECSSHWPCPLGPSYKRWCLILLANEFSLSEVANSIFSLIWGQYLSGFSLAVVVLLKKACPETSPCVTPSIHFPKHLFRATSSQRTRCSTVQKQWAVGWC